MTMFACGVAAWYGAVRGCVFLPGALSSCSDGVQNGNEDGVDCGGICPTACGAADTSA
jgi:hypothetical protein